MLLHTYKWRHSISYDFTSREQSKLGTTEQNYAYLGLTLECLCGDSVASFPVPRPAFSRLQYGKAYCKRRKAGRGTGNEASDSEPIRLN